MKYNENNNGKEKLDVFSVFTDKKYRSRAILVFYALFFIILIIFVRMNYKSQSNNSNSNINKKDNNEVINDDKNTVIEDKTKDDNETLDEIDKMFYYIDLNNYEFKYTITYNNKETVIEGKKYNDKYDFILNSKDGIIYFNGTSNYIKAKYDNSNYKLVTFPYVVFNYFDNNLIKNTIKNSTINGNVYEITNEKLSELIKISNLDNLTKSNKIELITKNNRVIEIKLDLTNLVSSYSKEKIDTSLILDYFNFDLVDDFKLE